MVRKCTPADEKIWVEMNREFMAYEYEDENMWESPLDKGDPAEVFRWILSEPEGGNALFMVEDGGCPIGFMNTVIFYSVWAHGKVLFLDDFFIREPYRGKGHGRAALAELAHTGLGAAAGAASGGGHQPQRGQVLSKRGLWPTGDQFVLQVFADRVKLRPKRPILALCPVLFLGKQYNGNERRRLHGSDQGGEIHCRAAKGKEFDAGGAGGTAGCQQQVRVPLGKRAFP